MLRAKLTLIITLIMLSTISFGQQKVDSTTAARDTTLSEVRDNILDNIPIVSLDENDNQDGSAQNISAQMGAGRDPFHDAAIFHFNAVRFRIRGYDADQFTTMMNGAPMENLDNGFTPFGLWGGLNDVMRTRIVTNGLRMNKYTLGDVGGVTFMETRASKQRKQTKVSYSSSNGNYANRIMLTYTTGLRPDGWAFAFSGSRRWSAEGYVPGTYYDGESYFIGIDKKINEKHLLSLVSFAAPMENGRQGASVAEMQELAGSHYYNPYWGYQNGKARNASVAKSFQPITILTHEWKISPKTNLLTAASYVTGNRSTTGLDWYNAADPRPDYYRYLPSYYKDDSATAASVREQIVNDVNLRQINWDRLYNVNYASYASVQNANGIQGNTVSGKRSLYILEERITNTNRYAVNSTLNTSISSHIDLTAGASFENQKNHYYKKVNDLLGGDFYVNINQYAERDFIGDPAAIQNDVNNPNRILGVGDKFGYDYDINIQRANAWVQTDVKFRKLEFFIGASHTYTRFWREGYVRFGLFPNNSFGRSADHEFYNYSIKGGITFKLNNRNYFFADGAYMTKAPYFDNAFISPRTKDIVQKNLMSEKITSAEAGYVMNAPTVKFRLTGYYTQFKDQLNVLTFYADDIHQFGNFALSNIGKEHMGLEIGAEVILYKGLTLNAAGNIGRYLYTTRQKSVVTLDNFIDSAVGASTIYSNNFYVPTAQQAYTAGLNYRSRKYWFASINVNYFDQLYLDFNPTRRTVAAVEGLDPKSEEFHRIIDQTALPAQVTVDASIGKSWLIRDMKVINKRTFINFNLGVNNLLNNRDIVSGGFEQLRFDYANRDINKFAPKLFYSYGINYYATVSLRF
ncbi:TonB-dependent receptor [soil metagenome]